MRRPMDDMAVSSSRRREDFNDEWARPLCGRLVALRQPHCSQGFQRNEVV
jgi:hypothetical protein